MSYDREAMSRLTDLSKALIARQKAQLFGDTEELERAEEEVTWARLQVTLYARAATAQGTNPYS